MNIRLNQGHNVINITTSDISHFAIMASQNADLTITFNPQPTELENLKEATKREEMLVPLVYESRGKHWNWCEAVRILDISTDIGHEKIEDFLTGENNLGKEIMVPRSKAVFLMDELEDNGYTFSVGKWT